MYESIRYTQTVFDTLVEIYMSFGTAHTTILFSWSLEDILHRKSFGSIEIRWQRWCVKRIYIIIIKIDTYQGTFSGIYPSEWVSESAPNFMILFGFLCDGSKKIGCSRSTFPYTWSWKLKVFEKGSKNPAVNWHLKEIK